MMSDALLGSKLCEVSPLSFFSTMATLIESICRWNLIFHRVLGEDCIALVWLTEEAIFTTASQRLAFLLRSLQSRFPSQSYRRAPVPLKFCKASRQRQIFKETKSCHHAVCVDVTNHSWTSCYMFHFHGNFPQNIGRLGNYLVLPKSVYWGIWSRRPLAGRIWPIHDIHNMHVCWPLMHKYIYDHFLN